MPRESPLVLRESLGSSHNRLTSAEDYEEALLSGYPPVGLLDAKNVYHAEQKAEDYEEALLSGYPPVGLLDAKNVYHAEQKGLPRPERRGLRSPWGQVRPCAGEVHLFRGQKLSRPSLKDAPAEGAGEKRQIEKRRQGIVPGKNGRLQRSSQ